MISHFNPALVLLNYTLADGEYSVTFGQLDSEMDESIRLGFAQGLGIGAAVLLLFVSWFVVKNKKTPMFILHQTSLALLVIRSGLYLGYLLGNFNSLSFKFSGLFFNYWDSFHLTIAVNVFYILLIACVECILVLQTRVIYKGSKRFWAGIIFPLFSAALAIVVVVLYIISIIHNLLKVKAVALDGYVRYASWEINLPYIMFSASIIYTCVLLIAKLIIAVRTRRVLGLKQFDAFHILLIMTTQTCIIPSIMAIYSYALKQQLNMFINISVIIIVCNLPFSSLWATSTNNAHLPTSCQETLFSRLTTNESSERTLQSFAKMLKIGTPISDFEKGTLADSLHEASGMHADVDSIEKILREVEQENAYEN